MKERTLSLEALQMIRKRITREAHLERADALIVGHCLDSARWNRIRRVTEPREET